MAAINWIAGSGSWTTASDWSPATVPGSSDDAVINASGAYTVTLSVTITVNSIAISASGATLSVHDPSLGQPETVLGSLTNSGSLNIDTGGNSFGTKLSVGGDLSNSGTVNIGTGFAGDGGSTVTISGNLNNSGTLNIHDDTATATVVTANALTAVGTINLVGDEFGHGSGAAELILTSGAAPSTLSSTVTLFGPSLLEFASGGISSIAASGKLIVGGGQAFVADSGATSSNSALTGLSNVAGDFELQHGAALSLSGGLTVSGSLNVDTDSNSSASMLAVGGDLTNSGTVNIGTGFAGDGGSTVTISGNLNNSGTLNIHDDTATATVVTANALTAVGTINLVGDEFGHGSGAAELILTSGAAPSTLSSSITLFGPSLLEFASGGISSIAASGKLIVGGGQAFVADSGATSSNSALTGLSNVAGDFELQHGAALSLSGGLTVSGSLNVDTDSNSSASKLGVGGDLTNSGTVNIGTGFAGDGGSTVTISGNLNNSGTLNIHDDTATATVVTANALTAVGTINLVGDEFGHGSGAAELILTSGAAPSTLSSSITLFGPSLLEFASGGISSIAASGKLIVGGGQAFVADSGATSSNSALTGLSNVAGDFELQHGAALSLSGGLTVSGSLNVDTDSNSSASKLGVGGDLTNSGTVNIGTGFAGDGGSTVTISGNLNNSGTLNIHDDTATATVVTANALTAVGTINLVGDEFGHGSGAAELILTSGAAPSTLSSSITLFGPSLLEFASGGISSIAASGKLIVGGGQAFVADSGATSSNSALTGLSNVAGDFELQHGAALSLSGGLTVSGSLNVDTDSNSSASKLGVGGDLTNSGTVNIGTGFAGDGGSTVTISGNLNNSGTLNIHDDTATATVVTANALTAVGTINLVGDEFGHGSGAAELILTSGAAPSTLSSSITLFGPSLLEFASGGISSIAASGKLIVGGGQAFVADSGATSSNSALTGLSNVAGDFELQHGAALSLSGGLTVSGSLNVDTDSNSSASKLGVGGDLTNSGTVNIGTGFAGDGGSTVTISGNLNNSGTLNIHDDTATATVVTANALTTVGTINLVGDEFGHGSGAAELILTSGAAPSTLSSTVTLFGPSLLEFASGGISNIAASGKLIVGGGQAFVADSGATSSNSALTGLSNVAGDFELQHGAALSLSGGLTVSGSLNVDTDSNSSASMLAVGGDLTNSGTVNIGTGFNRDGGSTVTVSGNLNNSGTLNIHDDTASATVVTANALTNSGTINLLADEFGDGTGTAELVVSGAATNDGTINVNSSASLTISGALAGNGNTTLGQNAQLAVEGASGGTITFNGAGANLTFDGRATFTDTITGMTLGDSIVLRNTAATGASVSGQTLTVQLTGGGTLAYRLTGNFTGESFATTQIGSDSDITLVAGADQPPVTTVPSSETVAAGVVTALSGISVSDSQAVNLNEPIATTLSDASGVLSAYTGLPGGGGSITGAGTNLLTIAGTVAQVNADLSTLSIVENVGGSDTINVTTSDGRGGSDNHQIAVTVSGTSNAPVPIPSGKTVEVATSANVIFVGSGGILKIDNPTSFNGTIAGVGLGATIDFKNTLVTAASINGGTLSITESGGPTLNYAVSGALSGNYFAITGDGNNGSKLVLSTIASTAAQYYTNFRPAFVSLNAALADGAGASRVAAAIITVYDATITDALTVIGNADWGSAYGSSGQATTTLRSALANGATRGQILNDTVNLFGTIVAGAVSVVAGGGSQQAYQNVSAAAATLGSDISQGASASQIQSDLSTLYSAIRAGAPRAVNPSFWQTAQNQSAGDAQTLSADMSNGAASAQILNDVSALYDSIVSGSLNAVGGSALQLAYTGGGETILKLGTGTVAVDGNGIIGDVAGLYNAVAATVAAPTVGSTAIQNYQNVVAAANVLLADVPNSFSPVRIANDGASLSQSVLADIIATVYGESAEQAYRQTLQEQAQVDLDLGGNAPLAQYKADESALANNTAAGVMAALGGAAMQQAYNTALQTYNTLKADVFGRPPASGAQTQSDAAAADAAIVSVVDLIDSDAQAGFSAALTGDAQTLDQFWQGSESSGQNYFQNLANQIIQYQNAFIQNYQLFSTDLQNNGGTESAQDLGYAQQMTGEQGSLAQLTAAFFIGAEEGPRGGVDVQSFGTDLAGPTNGPPPDFPDGPPPDSPPDDLWGQAGGGTPGGGGGGGGSGSGDWSRDAHLTTYDGLHYDFQAEGEFVVSKSLLAGDSFQVQARLQPWGSSSSVSVTTQIGASVGSDRVTFGVGRADPVWVNGNPSTLSTTNPVISLNGGTLLELSPNSYEIKWNTGEVLLVTASGSYLNLSIGLPTNRYPGSLEGLLGPNGVGTANDLQLADGTVLSQPLTSSELYGEFANAWRITQANSLLDYGQGQTTATFTDVNFPADAVSLANLPPNVVSQAAAAVQAAGITDPTLAADAELDYIATGDPSFIADALSVQQQGNVITPATVTQGTPAPTLGVNPVVPGVVASSSGTTAVSFNAYLTSAAATDTSVSYQVVAAGPGYFDASTFGGNLPSGQVAIPQNQTTAQFTITLPQGALGSSPSEDLEVQISGPSGQPIFAPIATAVVVNSQAEPGTPPAPTVALVTPIGALTQNGSTYSLNLGTLLQGAMLPNILLSLNNTAAGPADELGGTFSTGAGSGFGISANGPITPLAAGLSETFYITADTSTTGSNSETFTFAPTDVNASGYSAGLPVETLTATDTVEAAVQGTVNTPSEVTLPNVRVGTTDEEPLSVTNATPPPGAALDASIFMINNATGSGTITDLGAGATDNTDISVGVTTSTAGPKKGEVILSLTADAGGGVISPLPNQFVEVFGSVYRPASPSVAPIIAPVGNSSTQVTITNNDPADGYSENLIASVVSTTGGITGSGSTGDIAAQATNNAITLDVSAASAGVAGTVTLDFTTDGTGVDGLGAVDLGQQTFSVSALAQLIYVSSGVVSGGLGIVSGGILEVLSGGTASGATISSGGTEIISAGGSDLGTQISGGLQLDYGSAGGATVFTGSQVVESGGLATSTTVNSGGTELVLARGVATSTVIYKGATETISAGGTDSLAQISGTQNLYGTATSDAIFDPMAQPGVQNVEAGGTAFATTISSGGEQIVFSAGSASGTIVSSGGTEIVSGGSTDLGAKISGGVQLDYGYASGATVFTGSQVVETGGTASGTGVIGGGFELVSSGGTGAATTISGGKEELAAGAVASGAITFAGTGGILKIDGTVMPTNVVSGFVEGDTFDLAGVAFSSGGTAQVVSGHVLQVVENATTYNLQLDSSVSYATDAFRLTSDGSGGTDVIIHGPALSNIATSGSYVEEGGAITLATSGTVSDQDSSTLIGATVAITSGTFANDADVLAANTSGTSITASYNSGTETLTLSGTDTLAHYQQVLRSVSFVAGENPTNYGADPTRTVTWTVNDGGASFNLSPPQTTTIGITNVNDPPVLSNVASTVTFHSGTTTTLSPNTSVSDPDDLSLVGGTVIVTSGGFANDGDVLSATTSGTNITATYNSGSETLTLSGTDTLAHYQSVLDSVTLASGNNPTNTGANRTRTVTWQVNDGEAANNLSTPVQTTVKITTIDSSRPVVTPTSLAVNQSHLHTVAASTLFTAGDADGDFIVQYDFWDTGVGGAHWIINGTPSIPNTDNYASNLSQVGYQSGDGTDTLYVRASDGTGFGPWSQAFTVTDTAPVVTPTSANVNVGHGTVAATSLFTAADADADGIVQYDLWDSGQAGGDWLLNGNALPNGQDNFVPGSQLSQVTYRGGAGTETIYERASDGIQYGAWVSINATGADTAPVVEPTSASIVVSHNSSVAASTLFTVYDQDGDTITQYDFWDDGAGGGHWHLPSGNSVPNADNFVSAAQLSQVAYTPGAGSDTLWVRANDGVQWSAWSNPFTATDAAPASTPAQLMVSAFAGKTFAASNLFTAADADGDGIFQYDFWNSGTNGGQWMLGTSVLPAGQDNPVPKAQLSKVTYKAGTGPDTIWERATDGIHFGAWSPAVSVVFAPVANSTQSASNISHDQTVAATTLFTATDADGDPIVQYDFWDTGMGGAHWVINGHAGNINADNIVTDPTQVSYQSGTGTDTLWMRVADASAFGPWSQPFTATDTAPVTTPVSNTIFAATGQTFAASSLFTANDADTDPPVQYDFWDSGAGGGHWFNGAQQLGNGQSNPVSIAQLSQITYHAGSGTDTLWVRTNDGLQWSAWSNPFTATGGTTQSSPSSVNIPAGGSTEIGPTSAASANFASNTGTLKLDNSQSFTGTVAGLVGQDALDLADINFINGTTTANLMNATSAGGTLHVTDGTHQANIALLGNYLASTFTTPSDGHGGTAVIDPAVLGGVAPLVTPPHT